MTESRAAPAPAAGEEEPPNEYVLDFDDQALAPLSALDHVGTVVASADRERQVRLLRLLQRDHEYDWMLYFNDVVNHG